MHIVTITMIDNPSVLRVIHNQGASCILSKTDAVSHLIGAVHAAYVGSNYLSPYIRQRLQDADSEAAARPVTMREPEVVRLFGAGCTVGEIAVQLHRCKQTIGSWKSSAMKKLGIVRDADLIRHADERKLANAPAGDALS